MPGLYRPQSRLYLKSGQRRITEVRMEFTCCFRESSVHLIIAHSPDARSWWTVSQRRRNLSRPGRNTVRRRVKLWISVITHWTSRQNAIRRAQRLRPAIYREVPQLQKVPSARGLNFPSSFAPKRPISRARKCFPQKKQTVPPLHGAIG